MSNEPTSIYCVDVLGRMFVRSMYLHESDQTWWSHPQKRVNPLEKWRFHSQDKDKATEAAALIKQYQKVLKALDHRLEALRDDA